MRLERCSPTGMEIGERARVSLRILVKQPISPISPLDACESEFPQMHAGDQKPLRADLVEKP